MAAGTLYSYPDNFRAAKVLITAQYSKADVKLSQNFVFGETNKSREFLKKFPSGKVPAFETKDGKYLQDSNAIAYYVADEQLRGRNEYEKAQVLQWIGYAESEILPAACSWVFPVLGVIKKDATSEQAYVRAREDIKSVLTLLNNHLFAHTFLVWERISLADIVVACNLYNLYKYALDWEYREPFVNVNRWFNTLINQEEFQKVLGRLEYVEEPVQAFGGQQKGDGKTKKKEEKKEKKQQQQPKKETPKKEKEPEEELDAADAALAAEPKTKDPLDALPKGTFNFDDFKRVYSNESEDVSIKYFWEHFDKENYSIWIGEYKYPEELSKVFMSCNLITGMFQRLDKLRKNAFASVCLFGNDNDSTISGIWVFKGQELVFPLSPDWQIDYESYDWKKLDSTSAETKKLVDGYLGWTASDKSGRKFNQGKIFK